MQVTISTAAPGLSPQWVCTPVAIDCSQWCPAVQVATEAIVQHARLARPRLALSQLAHSQQACPRTLPWSLDCPEPFSLLHLCSCGSPLLECFPPSPASVRLRDLSRGHHLQEVFSVPTLFPRLRPQASTCSLISLHLAIAHAQDSAPQRQ